MSAKTIWRSFYSCNNYAMPDPVPPVDCLIEYWYGAEEKISKNRTFTSKPGKGQHVKYITVCDRQVMIVRRASEQSGRALLYLYGGGFTSEISGMEKRASVKFGRLSMRDVWIPRYPSCADVSAREVDQGQRVAAGAYGRYRRRVYGGDGRVYVCAHHGI